MASPLLVLGAGSWGTALAILLARNGNPTHLWAHDPAHVDAMQRNRSNGRYLPNCSFPDGLVPVSKPRGDYAGVLLGVPVKGVRSTVQNLLTSVPCPRNIAWACKGIETATHKLPHQILDELLPACSKAVISGPSFAQEVALGLPTAVTVASAQPALAQQWVRWLHGKHFRAYMSSDVTGVELCGAIKNVLAIAAGVSDGLQCGANSRAALITRGLAEMTRLGVKLGGQPETFMGLAGLGDLVLTCTDDQSRNRRVGIALGEGQDLVTAIERLGQVAEGVATAREVACLAEAAGLEMPITEQVVRLLAGQCRPDEAMAALLSRTPKHEYPLEQ